MELLIMEIFANDAMLYLPSDVASTCIYTFCSLASSSYEDLDASSLMNNLSKHVVKNVFKLIKWLNNLNKKDFLSIVDPDTLDSYSESDSLALAASLSSAGKTLTDAQVEALAGNLPDTYSVPIDNLTALANALPLTCFDSTPPADLVTLIANGKLKFSTMDDSRKIYIATLVYSNLFSNILIISWKFFPINI